MKTYKSIVVTLLVLFVPILSNAIVEIRAHYGFGFSSPDKMNDTVKSSTGSESLNITSVSGYGGDLLIKPPVTSFIFGARYEAISAKKDATISNVAYTVELEQTRLAAVLGYRLVDTMVYLGPIATYGLSHTNKYTEKASSKTEYKSNDNTSYSVGFEGGIKAGFWRLGAEAGYESWTAGSIEDENGAKYNRLNLDRSGPYAKILAGVGF